MSPDTRTSCLLPQGQLKGIMFYVGLFLGPKPNIQGTCKHMQACFGAQLWKSLEIVRDGAPAQLAWGCARFNEWGQAMWSLQKAELMESASGPKYHFMSLHLAGTGLIDGVKSQMTGSVLQDRTHGACVVSHGLSFRRSGGMHRQKQDQKFALVPASMNRLRPLRFSAGMATR